MSQRMPYEAELLRPNVFEVDLDAITHNLSEIQRWIGQDTRMFAVLKCNAYGFGLREVGQVVQESSAYGVAVADLAEAVDLRRHGVRKPILVYANNLPSAASTYVDYDLIATVCDAAYAEAYAQAATRSLKVFLKVDVGLHRNGMYPEDVPQMVACLKRVSRLQVEGIYAHLNVYDPTSEPDYLNWQFDRFRQAVGEAERLGLSPPMRMVASSPIVAQCPTMHLNAVDPGKLIYGVYWPSGLHQSMKLASPFRALKTRIIAKKRIVPGPFDDRLDFEVGSGRVFGVVPLGWGDGFPPAHAAKGWVLVRGKRVRVLGALHVEHARIDLSDVPDSEVGDEVTVIGRQGSEEISLQEVAGECGLGGSELTRTVREHLPRLFYRGGQAFRIRTILGERVLPDVPRSHG